MSAIFPQSLPEIDSQIISFLPTLELYALSTTSHRAHEAIPNALFEKRFKQEHPLLAVHDYVFSKLCTYHPDQCWKIACRALQPGRTDFVDVKGFGDPVFLEEAIPRIKEKKKSEELKLERELNGICGSFYRDPSSPIHQIHQAYEFYMELRKKLKVELSEETDALESVAMSMGEEAFQVFDSSMTLLYAAIQRFDTRIGDGALPPLPTKEEMKEWVRADLIKNGKEEELLLNHFELAFPYFFCSSSIEAVQKHVYFFSAKYKELERKRVCLEARLRENKEFQKLLFSQESVTLTEVRVTHSLDLNMECGHIAALELHLSSMPSLEKCYDLIKSVIDGEFDDSAAGKTAVLGQIHAWINQFPNIIKIAIWEELYNNHANGVHEHEWSEKHFAEFLPSLLGLVGSQWHTSNGIVSRAKLFSVD